MADPISPLRTNRGGPSLFDRLSTAGQISQEDQYAANPENQFSKGLRTGAAGLTAGSFASEALRKEVAGDKEFADSRDRALQTVRDTRMYAPRVSSLRDVNSIGDAGDFAAGVIGQGAMSMAPSLAAAVLTRGRGLTGKATAFGGAMVPSYEMERGEAALNQYQDPEQMKASAQERDLAATAKGGINAALESIVPAGLAGSLLRKPAGSLLGHVGRNFLTESATETTQQAVGFGAQKYIDPTKELDPWDLVDAAVAGGLTGGAMSASMRAPSHAAQAILDKAPKLQMPAIKNPFQRGGEAGEAGGVVDLPEDPSGGGSGPADTMLGKVAGLGAAVQDRFGDGVAAAGGKAKDVAGKAKDIVSDTLDRMTEAVDTSANPGEFLSKVFGSSIDEEAAADLSGQPNPMLKGVTFEETEANIARDDEKRVARAARYADELLNDPATPDAVKQRVVDMGGDYTNPENRDFVARTLVAQRGGEKIAKAVQDLVDLGKSAFAKGSEAASERLSAAKKAAGDAFDTAQDRVIKKNLQSASPAEQAAFGKVIFDGLTDEAKADPLVRAQLAQVTNTVMAFAAKTGDITSKDLPTLTKMANAMSLFKDPDAMAAQLVEYGAIPRDADSFLGRIKRIQNAQQDLKQPNSFLVSSLTPEARELLTAPMLKHVAQLVDEFSLRDAAGEGDRIVEGLTQAFGSKENAQAVLDYYAQQNKANVRFDPNEQVRDAAGEIDSDELSSWEGSINERDAGKAAFRFKDAKTMRPFFKGSKDIDAARRDGTLGDEGTQTPYGYDQYVAETGRDGEAEVSRLLDDIDDRIAEHEGRKGEDRSAMINALKGQKSMVQDAYMRGGAQGALSMYEVLRTEAKDQNDLVATDEDLAKYASKKGASRVTFKRTDGTKLMLSAESMWKTFGDKTKGDTSGGKEGDTARARRLFKEAVASVLAREDIASLETSLSGLKIDDKGTEAEPKIDPVLREKIAHDLNKASGSLSEIKVGLQRMFKEYSAALSKGNLGKQAVYTFEDQLRTRVGQAASAVEAATTAPQRAVMRERHLLYERALERVLEMKQNFLDDGIGGNGNTDDLDPPVFSRVRKEMDTSKGERRVEEDTGTPVGTGGAPSMKPAAQKDLPEPKAKAKPADKNPAASSRETAKKVNDSQALSPDALTALHDVVVKENYDRLDTPVKVLKFAAMAAKAREQLKKIPELERTDEQDELRFKLEDMFDQDKGAAFDWESLWDGLDPTDAQKAQLESLVRPKAEPGTARQSTMKPKRGRPGKIDEQEILDEIARIRGKDVEVAFAKFADIGASGEFSMDKDKTKRLIKIAINSLNPMSVAWHESLHDFVAMLGGSKAERKLKADLLDAAEAPQVMKKLRELLKDHPDALKQIENDREERLAYMYQFWAEGALTLGPTGTNIFSRMAAFFREMLGVLSQDQKIDRLFTALHTGKFSEPSLVGAVLEDLKAQTLGDKARAVAGPIGDAAEAMFTGATDRLRNTNIEALTELADMFHREPGREIHSTVNMGAKPSFVSSVDSIGRKAAEARLAAGEDAEKVFADTKWFKDAQGKMVREIDDSRLFKAAWEAVKGAVASNADLLKVFDAVLDGKVDRLGTLSLKDVLEDMGLPHMAAKVGDVQIELSSDRESHIIHSKDKITAVRIGLAQAFDGKFSKLSAEDRKNAIANVGALTVLHEVQHVLQVLDGRADDMFTGEYSEQRGEIEAFDVEARYVARYIAEKLGGEGPSLPELAKKVPSMVDMEHSDFAANVTQPMFTKRHSARRTYGGGGVTQELPFLQRRAQQVGKRLNKLQDILKDTTSEERRRALENMQNMKPASSPLEKELAAYLKEMHDYMVDRGVKRFDTKMKKWVDLGNVKDYFPRVWDKDTIRNNEAEFIALLEQYIDKEQARESFNALVNGDGSLELAENEHHLGFTPWNPAVLDRKFTFINPSNAEEFAKFQSKDMADIMTSYTQRAVHRAEYAHTFGNDGEVITSKFLEAQKQGATTEEIAMARKATMAMEGTLGYDFNPRLKEVMSGIVTYQNIVLLPLSLFSNLIDPLGVAMRSNDMKEAWKAFTYGIKGIADQIRGAGDDAQTEMARTLGLIDDQNMLEAMGHVYNSMHMSRFLKNVNSKFFRYNGMEMWNQRMRVAAMMAAQRFIISHAEIVASEISHGGNKNDSNSYKNHSKRYLEELGIAETDVFQLQDGTIALTKDQLLQAGAKKSEVLGIEKRIQAAVFKWVDGAVLRPNAAHRPVWGSDPRYQLIFHLKQFTFSFHNTILRRVGEELKHGNVAPGWILLSYVPFMFLSDVLKGSLTGTLNTTADLYDVASQSIARAGIMGTGVFGADAMGDLERGNLPGTSFLGPSFDHLTTLLSGITGHAGVGQVVDRSVPFAKYL